jgi:hypothetical protein
MLNLRFLTGKENGRIARPFACLLHCGLQSVAYFFGGGLPTACPAGVLPP